MIGREERGKGRNTTDVAILGRSWNNSQRFENFGVWILNQPSLENLARREIPPRSTINVVKLIQLLDPDEYDRIKMDVWFWVSHLAGICCRKMWQIHLGNPVTGRH